MKKYLKIIIFVVFILLSLIIGFFHEPWADEAQAWLIARDASVLEILIKICRYEGCPALWHLILKFLIYLKFPYKYYFLIPIFFTSIGLYIIIFKLDIDDIYKVLLPFTYFIAFEYGIKARNYCLFLPILSMIAYLYKKRKERVYIYNFFVLILSFVSLHGAIISGMLWIFEVLEILKQLGTEAKTKEYKKEIISVIVMAIVYIFILITLIPNEDVYVNITIESLESYNLINKLIYYGITLAESFALKEELFRSEFIPSVVLLTILFYCILKNNKKKFIFLSIFCLEVAFIFIIRVTEHHQGLVFLTFLFSTYLVKDDIDDKFRKIIRILLIIVFCVQIVWYVKTYIADINIEFSGGKATAQYLKTLDYDTKKIYGTGYYLTAILPYFDENIFEGPRGGKTYYIWGKSNDDWIWSSNTEYKYPNILEDNPDIVVLQDYYDDVNEYYEKIGLDGFAYPTLIKTMKQNKNYKVTYFPGVIIFKGLEGNREKEGFYVFERIN